MAEIVWFQAPFIWRCEWCREVRPKGAPVARVGGRARYVCGDCALRAGGVLDDVAPAEFGRRCAVGVGDG